MVCSEHRSQDISAVGADLVAMAPGNLVQDAVSAEDAEQIRDASAAPALVFGIRRRRGIEEALEVLVP
jgi:hypothetical protein